MPLVACGCNRAQKKLQPGRRAQTEASADVPFLKNDSGKERRAMDYIIGSNGKERQELAELAAFSVFQQVHVCTRHSTNFMPKWLPILAYELLDISFRAICFRYFSLIVSVYAYRLTKKADAQSNRCAFNSKLIYFVMLFH